jgi:NAD(P)H-dependent flavin oxidoreductase YrpB (nitropropane dioxygenase family)
MSVGVSGATLAAAVANAGGVGTIGAMGLPPEEVQRQIKEARRHTDGVFGVNLMYAGTLFDTLLDLCIQERVDYVAIGAGFARGPFRKLQEAGIAAFAIISSVQAARIAARTPGITGVVVESGHAGGHLGPKDPEVSTWDLFPGVLAQLRQSEYPGPVIAAGGLLTRKDVMRALAMGADGVQLGTRFALSNESSAHPAMKQGWLAALGTHVQWWSPTGYASRAAYPLNDAELPRLNGAAGVQCRQCLKLCLHRQDPGRSHCILRALLNSLNGDVKHGLLFSGARVGEITETLTVREIFRRLLSV